MKFEVYFYFGKWTYKILLYKNLQTNYSLEVKMNKPHFYKRKFFFYLLFVSFQRRISLLTIAFFSTFDSLLTCSSWLDPRSYYINFSLSSLVSSLVWLLNFQINFSFISKLLKSIFQYLKLVVLL